MFFRLVSGVAFARVVGGTLFVFRYPGCGLAVFLVGLLVGCLFALLHLKSHGFCFGFPVPGVWAYVYRGSICWSDCL